MVAGTSTMRTMVASMSTAVGEAEAEHLHDRVGAEDEGPEDADHDEGGRLVITRAVRAQALDHAAVAVAVLEELPHGPGLRRNTS